jgi:predicted kinase
MLKIFFTKGTPGSGKSTWAKSEIAKEPLNYLHINNDDLRSSFNGSVYSFEYEKIITDTRNFLIREGLKRNLSIIIDNVNANNRHWETTCKIAKDMNKDVQVFEKLFYADLDTLLERNAKRDGVARVPDEVVKKFFKDLGGEQFKTYRPRVEVFTKRDRAVDRIVEPMVQNEKLERAVIFDNDGTISIIHPGRSPYDAATCDQDIPQKHAIECMKLYHDAGYKIFFVSGREEKDRAPTERFYQKHFPEVKYELFMRPTGSFEKDVIIKERIFNEHIKDKYFIAGWFDDRLQIVDWLFLNGFPVFRLGDPRADF